MRLIAAPCCFPLFAGAIASVGLVALAKVTIRAVRATLVAERGAARALVRAKQTDAALVVPAGISAALAVSQSSQLIHTTPSG